MQSSQREREILDLLNDSGSGRIQDLSQRLNVTEETIRRNVKRLEAQGLVTKVHGGVHLKDWGPEPTFAQRFVQNPAAKRQIARHLARMIGDGSSLFLDIGSTTAHVAEALRDHRDLLVVTNSLAVAQTLATRNGNRVFMAGGELRSHDGGAFGAEALAFVRQFRVRYAVLSAVAVNARAGFLLHDLREAEFSRAIIEQADEAIMAVDATKFGLNAPIRITDPSAIGKIVTDAAPPADLAAALGSAGVQVVVAPAERR
jgi:DeoR family glycerol-3-phosphate regulon repressor